MFVSLAGRWWPDRPIVCWLEMWYPNIQKWGFLSHRRRKLFNMGGVKPARPTSIWGRVLQNVHTRTYACTYTCTHAHAYMLINTHSCMHTHVCMHAHAWIHLYIYILIWKSFKSKQAISTRKNKKKQIYACNWVGAHVVSRKIVRF